MNFDRPWTAFALEAEADAFGFGRIADAHNTIVTQLREELETVKREREAISAALHEVEGQVPCSDETCICCKAILPEVAKLRAVVDRALLPETPAGEKEPGS